MMLKVGVFIGGTFTPSLSRGYISYHNITTSLFQSNTAYENSFFDIHCITSLLRKVALQFIKGNFAPLVLPNERLEVTLLPTAPSGVLGDMTES